MPTRPSPKKHIPIVIYAALVICLMIAMNRLILPVLTQPQTRTVDYGSFLTLIKQQAVGVVEIETEEINFILLNDLPKDVQQKILEYRKGQVGLDEASSQPQGEKPTQEATSALERYQRAGESSLKGVLDNYHATRNTVIYKTSRVDDPDLVNRLFKAGAVFQQVYPKAANPIIVFLLSYLLPLGLFLLVGLFLNRYLMKRLGANLPGGGSTLKFGKSNARIYLPEEADRKTFADVAGEVEAKEALSEIVDFLHDPSRYEQIGAKCPKGVLLVGPPGTGKTLLAKAVAGEARVPFFSISGSEFVQMFVGMGASKVRDLFEQANQKAPCIVFIDEIDTIGKKRDGVGMTSNDEREQTLNQLLTEMDGFQDNKGVVILAATNRPDSLDPALLRPGRFDRRVAVELPDLAGRAAILRVHAKQVRLSPQVDFEALARQTAGTSGAELANMINEAALRAVRRGSRWVEQHDLEESVDVVLAGTAKTSAVIDPNEKRVIAYHEIGHALVAAKLEGSAPVQKITIVPRTSGALGFTMQAEHGDKYLYTKEDLLNQITAITGGRAAEEVIFGRVTTGAANDIQKVTRIARAMVAQYGMSERFGMLELETTQNIYLGGEHQRNCSEEMAAKVDNEVQRIVEACHAKACQILEEHKAKLHALAQHLLEQETISGAEFMAILEKEDSVEPESLSQEREQGSEPHAI